MSNGIYCYKDSFKNNKIVYIGKDSHINKNRRHIQHNQPSKYNAQPFNRILQKNPKRYEYSILKQGDFDDKLLKVLEILYIRRYKPKFNYTIGGDGSTGFKHSEESKIKISSAKKGESFSTETKLNMSQSRNTSGYYRVSKRKNKKYLNGFIWCYTFPSNGKRKTIMDLDLKNLENKVRLKGLPWHKFE